MSELIWTPEDEEDLFSRQAEEYKTTTVKVKIINVKYHPNEKYLMLGIKMPSGELKSLPMHESCFSYGKVSYKNTSRDIIEKEMCKLENSFKKAIGKHILLNLPMRKAL